MAVKSNVFVFDCGFVIVNSSFDGCVKILSLPGCAVKKSALTALIYFCNLCAKKLL